LRIGEGCKKIEVDLGEDVIQLPNEMVLPSDKSDDLITSVYGNGPERFFDVDFMRGEQFLQPLTKMWMKSIPLFWIVYWER
jgi:hypothetical protein